MILKKQLHEIVIMKLHVGLIMYRDVMCMTMTQKEGREWSYIRATFLYAIEIKVLLIRIKLF